MLLFTPFLMFSSVGRYIRFEPIIPKFERESVTAVSSILQDREGFMWFGTGRGMAKYDGYNFTLYSPPQPDQKTSLSLDSVFPMHEDRAGDIWFGTSGDGLRIFDKKTGKYVTYKHNPFDQDSLSDNNITSLYQDSSGIMWVATLRGGINKTLNNQIKFKHFKHNLHNPRSIQDNDVHSICLGSSGFLWIGTSRGLDKIEEKNALTIHLRQMSYF